jgi:hypothetical protein
MRSTSALRTAFLRRDPLADHNPLQLPTTYLIRYTARPIHAARKSQIPPLANSIETTSVCAVKNGVRLHYRGMSLFCNHRGQTPFPPAHGSTHATGCASSDGCLLAPPGMPQAPTAGDGSCMRRRGVSDWKPPGGDGVRDSVCGKRPSAGFFPSARQFGT